MATRKTESPAAINRRIDALNKGRGANPRPREGGVFTNLDAPKHARTRFFEPATDDWALSHGLLWRLQSQHGVGVPVKFSKTRAYVAVDEGADGKPVFETWRISGLKYWNENPARAPRVSTLVARKPAAKNPARKAAKLPSTEYEVQYSPNGSDWHKWTSVLYEDMAKAIATRTAKEFPKYHVRVIRKS